jgi:hypothetical protein
MRFRPLSGRTWILAAALTAVSLSAQPPPAITAPREALGFNLGDDYMVANYTQLAAYWKKLAAESGRVRLESIGKTEEGREQWMAIVSAPENIANLDRYKLIARKLALAEGIAEEQAHALAAEGKAVVWIDGGLHANESVGSQQLMEMVYQLVSRNDAETLRFLRDVIVLCVPANPDGQELIANWYMRGSQKPEGPLRPPAERSMKNLPRLYAKYVGHDDNRDFYMSNMRETTNMNRQLFQEWFPQIVYNHHQTGPEGAVVFMPPFRDPFNYHFDPLVPLGIELVGAAMHSRLVAEGKGGSAMRGGANYSTWWNGGLRTVAYFHNMIGILTEIIGSPEPMTIPLVPAKQLPQGDWPMPVAPGPWRFRQSIEYEIANNRAVLDLASRYRETWLFNIWRMGMNSIEKGNRDSWTVTPRRIAALAAAASTATADRGSVPAGLYETILHDPKLRDPRGYILPSGQADFPTATEFVNALIKNGIACLRATAPFQAAGRNYPAGSYVVKTAQAFRPHILDMFEPQDYPGDFADSGGPPNRPYDITGWTLAMQMGVRYDRVLDAFDGPFEKIPGLLPPPPGSVSGPANPAGYLISHQIDNSFTLLNRLLKAGAEVYWLKGEQSVGGGSIGTGALWVPATAVVRPLLERATRELGIPVQALANAPTGEALHLRPVRIGLIDLSGGSMPSGWTRWLFERYEMPFEVVYSATLSAGNWQSRFDVLVFPSGTFGGRAGGKAEEAAIPQLRKFVELGGAVVAIGSSALGAARALGLPVRDYLTDLGADGLERTLPDDKFYIPGSLLRMSVDNTNPVAFGMANQVDVFFDDSPVFKLEPAVESQPVSRVGWFAGKQLLESGWAWGQQYLDGDTAVAEAAVGKGKVVLLGPEVNFRDQSHGTYKLLFNSLYYGSAKGARLQ